MPPVFKRSEIDGLIFEQKPGIVYRFGDHYVRLNREGFRDRGFRAEKKKGDGRVVVLGDSMTMAIALPENEIYVSLLEERMNRAASGQRFEFYNMGVCAYNTAQEWLVYKNKAEKFKPDLVIVQFLLNDLTYSYPVYIGGSPIGRLKVFLGDHFRTYRMLSMLKEKWRTGAIGGSGGELNPMPAPVSPEFIRRVYDPKAGYFEQWESAAASFGRLNRSGTPVIFVIFPWLVYSGSEGEPYPYYEFHRRIEEKLDQEGIPWIDATPALLSRGAPSRFWAAPGDFHLNAEAHGIIAELLFPEVESYF